MQRREEPEAHPEATGGADYPSAARGPPTTVWAQPPQAPMQLWHQQQFPQQQFPPQQQAEAGAGGPRPVPTVAYGASERDEPEAWVAPRCEPGGPVAAEDAAAGPPSTARPLRVPHGFDGNASGSMGAYAASRHGSFSARGAADAAAGGHPSAAAAPRGHMGPGGGDSAAPYSAMPPFARPGPTVAPAPGVGLPPRSHGHAGPPSAFGDSSSNSALPPALAAEVARALELATAKRFAEAETCLAEICATHTAYQEAREVMAAREAVSMCKQFHSKVG